MFLIKSVFFLSKCVCVYFRFFFCDLHPTKSKHIAAVAAKKNSNNNKSVSAYDSVRFVNELMALWLSWCSLFQLSQSDVSAVTEMLVVFAHIQISVFFFLTSYRTFYNLQLLRFCMRVHINYYV